MTVDLLQELPGGSLVRNTATGRDYRVVGPRIVRAGDDSPFILTFTDHELADVSSGDRLVADLTGLAWEVVSTSPQAGEVVVDEPPGFTSIAVTGDWLDSTGRTLPLLAFTDGERWNGWECPWLDRRGVNVLIGLLAREHRRDVATGAEGSVDLLTWEGDVLVLHRTDDGETERVEPRFDEIGRPLWLVGFGWCWTELHPFTVLGDADVDSGEPSLARAVLPGHHEMTWTNGNPVFCETVYAADEYDAVRIATRVAS
jgi:hypothetical protein